MDEESQVQESRSKVEQVDIDKDIPLERDVVSLKEWNMVRTNNDGNAGGSDNLPYILEHYGTSPKLIVVVFLEL